MMASSDGALTAKSYTKGFRHLPYLETSTTRKVLLVPIYRWETKSKRFSTMVVWLSAYLLEIYSEVFKSNLQNFLNLL